MRIMHIFHSRQEGDHFGVENTIKKIKDATSAPSPKATPARVYPTKFKSQQNGIGRRRKLHYEREIEDKR